jgi:hypothetical protein
LPGRSAISFAAFHSAVVGTFDRSFGTRGKTPTLAGGDAAIEEAEAEGATVELGVALGTGRDDVSALSAALADPEPFGFAGGVSAPPHEAAIINTQTKPSFIGLSPPSLADTRARMPAQARELARNVYER